LRFGEAGDEGIIVGLPFELDEELNGGKSSGRGWMSFGKYRTIRLDCEGTVNVQTTLRECGTTNLKI
jgi:hypothetical protein